jgi:hypothetical protein
MIALCFPNVRCAYDFLFITKESNMNVCCHVWLLASMAALSFDLRANNNFFSLILIGCCSVHLCAKWVEMGF